MITIFIILNASDQFNFGLQNAASQSVIEM